MNAPQHTHAAAPAQPQPGFTVKKYGCSRYWAVVDAAGVLVCVTVYKRGAEEVARRLRG